MKITPIYPKNILKLPYFKGLFTGILIGFGIIYIILQSNILGVLILASGIIMYVIHTSEKYNLGL